MSISRIDRDGTENGTLVRTDGFIAVIRRHSNSEEVKVSISEFLQKNIKPDLGRTYRYDIYRGVRDNTRITNIRPVAYLTCLRKASVHQLTDFLPEQKDANGMIDWFDWSKGFGAVVLSSDESTAFLHISVIDDTLGQYGLKNNVQLKGQTVHVIVIPDPEKEWRVTKLDFV